MVFLNCLTIAYINRELDLRKENAILGKWKHCENSYDIEIYQSGSLYHARLVSNQKGVVGPVDLRWKYDSLNFSGVDRYQGPSDLELIKGLSYNENTRKWENGIVFDPVSGRMKRAKIWLKEKDVLVMRRFWYFSCFGSNIFFRKVVK